MSELEMIKEIIKSKEIKECDKVHFIRMLLTGLVDEEDICWIWEE